MFTLLRSIVLYFSLILYVGAQEISSLPDFIGANSRSIDYKVYKLGFAHLSQNDSTVNFYEIKFDSKNLPAVGKASPLERSFVRSVAISPMICPDLEFAELNTVSFKSGKKMKFSNTGEVVTHDEGLLGGGRVWLDSWFGTGRRSYDFVFKSNDIRPIQALFLRFRFLDSKPNQRQKFVMRNFAVNGQLLKNDSEFTEYDNDWGAKGRLSRNSVSYFLACFEKPASFFEISFEGWTTGDSLHGRAVRLTPPAFFPVESLQLGVM